MMWTYSEVPYKDGLIAISAEWVGQDGTPHPRRAVILCKAGSETERRSADRAIRDLTSRHPNGPPAIDPTGGT